MSVTINKQIDAIYARRKAAMEVLMESLKHLTRPEQYAVLTAWMSVEELEALAKRQNRQ